MVAPSADSTAAVLLREQIEFYEADAVPYDRWLASLADEGNATDIAVAARTQAQRLAGWLEHHAPLGDVLEIAAGTGRVSQILEPHVARLLLLDSSPTSLALADDKLAGSPAYEGGVCSDVFRWRPPRLFDTVVFAAWLHHVPDAAFDEFWNVVDALTTPGGRALFDFALDAPGAHIAPPPTPSVDFAAYHDPATGVSVRDLDGRRWTVVHETWSAEALARRLGKLGWELAATGPADESFQWATATRKR